MWWIHINIMGIISHDLFDDADINRQCRSLFVQGNIILCKFYMCSIDIKLTPFHTCCSPMYSVQSWWNYKKSLV